jgi:hypothetical protein
MRIRESLHAGASELSLRVLLMNDHPEGAELIGGLGKQRDAAGAGVGISARQQMPPEPEAHGRLI